MYFWLIVVLLIANEGCWSFDLPSVESSTTKSKSRSEFDYDSFGGAAGGYHNTPNFDLTNKEFWDQIYQNSMLNTKTKYNSLSGDKVCFTCPIDRNIFTSLYHEALSTAAKEREASSSSSHGGTPPRVTISWATQINENRVIFFCRNNTRIASSPVYLSLGHVDSSSSGDSSSGLNAIHDTDSGELEYSCENNNLCLLNVKKSYPIAYQCFVKSYILNVKLNVIVQLQYVLLYFTGDSVKFDYQKEVQVYEGQPFVVKCEVPETNPISSVNAYIDQQELKLTGLDKKTIDNRMTINTFSFEVNASRLMNGKRVKCEAFMRDLPSEIATQIDLRSRLSKEYTLSVYYLPTCLYKDRVYRTGINRSIVIECPINGSNPDVTYYKMIPPSTRTKVELIDNDLASLKKIGRYKIYPTSVADFGLYECIPRSLAGTTKCDIHVELGATPNPPEQCNVQFAQVNNKTFAQFSCRPGFNQGGSISFLSIYELVNKELKLSGRVNIDENKFDKEVPYITPVDPTSYYEYVIMQENNYGNSTSILLTLGEPNDLKAHPMMDSKNFYVYGGSILGIIFFLFVCGCCCSDLCSSVKSDNFCCKCCPGSNANKNPYDESLSYKKAPLDSDPSTSSHLNHQIYTSVFSSNPAEASKFSTKSQMKDNSTFEFYDNNASYNSLLLKSTPQAKASSRALTTINNKYYRSTNLQHREYLDDDEDEDNHYFNDNEELDHKTSSSSPYSSSATAPYTNKNNNNVNEYAYNNQSEDDYDGTAPTAASAGHHHHYETSERENLFAHAVSSKIDNPNLNKLTGSGLDSINNADRNKFRYNQNAAATATTNSLLPTKKSSYNLEHSKIMDANFQSELSMKLKSIRKYEGSGPLMDSMEQNPTSNELLYSQNYKAMQVVEHQDGTTGGTSSSEMQIKVVTTNGKPLNNNNNSDPNKSNQASASSCASSSSCSSNCDLILKDGNQKSQSNYSLIKTTLNGKPPILKPKPRNNIYQSSSTTTPTKDSGNETAGVGCGSGSSGSGNGVGGGTTSNKHSINSPSTSVTDVSSSNTCTPQHMPHKESSMTNNSKQQHNTPSLNNPNNVTTTFGLKTFSHNSNNYYDNLTIRSKKGSHGGGGGGANSTTTLERRNQHVKNSEC